MYTYYKKFAIFIILVKYCHCETQNYELDLNCYYSVSAYTRRLNTKCLNTLLSTRLTTNKSIHKTYDGAMVSSTNLHNIVAVT